MFGLFKFVWAMSGVVVKFVVIMGISTLIISRPPILNTDNRFEVIRSKDYVYQVNYEKDVIDSVEIFTKAGDFKGQYEYNELKGNHKKIIDSAH
jgi:hypothetical protein